jgi:hypothetical protein
METGAVEDLASLTTQVHIHRQESSVFHHLRPGADLDTPVNRPPTYGWVEFDLRCGQGIDTYSQLR